MKLKEKSFPLSFSLEQTTEFIKNTLEQKNWSDFEVIEVKIVFFPYYFFSYEVFFEEENKTVSQTKSGKAVLNGMTSQLEEISLPEEADLIEEIEEIPENISFEELQFKLSEKVELISQIKIAEKMQVPKDNVVIHSLQKVLFPVWIIDFAVETNNFQFMLSGVDGSVIKEEEIPERLQGFWEITSEALSELKHPKAWAEYTSSVVSDSTNFAASGNFFDNLLHNRRFQILILLIILIIVVLWSYKVF